jgi:hypothetical protein
MVKAKLLESQFFEASHVEAHLVDHKVKLFDSRDRKGLRIFQSKVFRDSFSLIK